MKTKLISIVCAALCFTACDAQEIEFAGEKVTLEHIEINEANVSVAQMLDVNSTEANASIDGNATIALSDVALEQGALLYKTCAPCHGEKAELTYADKVPPISSLSPTERLEKLKALRAGTAGDGEGYHGMGEVMKGHLVMNDKNLEILNAYIATLSNESAEANATSAPSAEANATSELVSAEASATSAPASAEASTTGAVSDAAAEQGALLYKTCAVCHGAKGEKTYAGKVPPIVNLSAAERLEKLQALRDGTAGDGKGYYGMGAVMKGQLRISDDNLVILNNYIETLK